MKTQDDIRMNVLVLGAAGMLGNAVMRFLADSPGLDVWGSVRSTASVRFMPELLRDRLMTGVDVENSDALIRLFSETRPDVVINCIGLVKQLAEADDPLQALPVNALLPHRLARLCAAVGARLVHVSTDCVFSGSRGLYREEDVSDARDLYGISKYLGEVDYDNAITLRTSIIGHELNSTQGLVGWFLAQSGRVQGYAKAIFSGLPTVELARVIRDHVIPHPEMHGLYHVSADPISKLELLSLVARIYDHHIEIVPDERVQIDRSLDSSRFRAATGYQPPAWGDLVARMREFG
jgi:dTDP-4-dehydrorhamnose reductase